MARFFHRGPVQALLAALVVIAIVGCVRDESGGTTASDADKNSARSTGKKGDIQESSPGAKDPMKEGY